MLNIYTVRVHLTNASGRVLLSVMYALVVVYECLCVRFQVQCAHVHAQPSNVSTGGMQASMSP